MGIYPVADDKAINVFVQSFFENDMSPVTGYFHANSLEVYRLTELFRYMDGTWIKLGEHRRQAKSIFDLSGLNSNHAGRMISPFTSGGKAWQAGI